MFINLMNAIPRPYNGDPLAHSRKISLQYSSLNLFRDIIAPSVLIWKVSKIIIFYKMQVNPLTILHQRLRDDKLHYNLGLLGEGTFGLVFRVRLKKAIPGLPLDYVMKILKPPGPGIDRLSEGYRSYIRTFRNEANILKGAHLKNVVISYGLFSISFQRPMGDQMETGLTLAHALEFIEGSPLARLGLPTNLALADYSILLIAQQIANGLYELHGRNIVHRDIKPDNIMVNPNLTYNGNEVKIIDLGLACSWEQVVTQEEVLVLPCDKMAGSSLYFSPEVVGRILEQAQIWPGSEVPHISSSLDQEGPLVAFPLAMLKENDIWALGVTLYHYAYQRSIYRPNHTWEDVRDRRFNLVLDKPYLSGCNQVINRCLAPFASRSTATHLVHFINDLLQVYILK